MSEKLKAAADNVLDYTVRRAGGAPGVVAMATDRKHNIYEGCAGVRERGKRLSEVFAERIFLLLGMTDIGFTLTDSMKARRAVLHDRAADGKLTPLPDLILPQPPEMEMGGHGLYASVGEYMKFIRMFLNDGAGPNGRVLKAETVERMSRNGLPAGMQSGGWKTSIPSLSNDGEFDPGIRKTWAYTFQRNEESTATGRPAGSLMWAGLGNLFSGSIRRLAWAVTGPRRSCPSRTWRRTPALWTSKAPSTGIADPAPRI